MRRPSIQMMSASLVIGAVKGIGENATSFAPDASALEMAFLVYGQHHVMHQLQLSQKLEMAFLVYGQHYVMHQLQLTQKLQHHYQHQHQHQHRHQHLHQHHHQRTLQPIRHHLR